LRIGYVLKGKDDNRYQNNFIHTDLFKVGPEKKVLVAVLTMQISISLKPVDVVLPT